MQSSNTAKELKQKVNIIKQCNERGSRLKLNFIDLLNLESLKMLSKHEQLREVGIDRSNEDIEVKEFMP